jgi:1,4-alpha-glucan branching enzyme
MISKSPAISNETIDAIVNGYHKDPFAVLGPHGANSDVVVRAFLPGVSDVRVVETATGDSISMKLLHNSGFYEANVPEKQLPFDYYLEIQYGSGDYVKYEDPYAFPDFLSEFDEYLLAEGTHLHMYERLGAHLAEIKGRSGVRFAVWAPNALRVSVVGDFNNWDGRRHPMRFHHNSGLWDIFIPGFGQGDIYKFEIKTAAMNYTVLKSDPIGFYAEMRPKTASIVWDLDNYTWNDKGWMKDRGHIQGLDRPINIYEIHLGSWRRKENNNWLTYNDFTEELIPYVKDMGYTHIELLPVAEHPYDGSWGYQVVGYFAVTSRHGTPDEFMAFVDACHQAGLGVIVDWVPAHFPRDQHGLSYFDGTFLYEHADPRLGSHPDWGTLIFNFGRNEVRQFLVSNAIFWLDKFHIDGLRVDAVASMLYLDFSREEGRWVPNKYGGRENIDAIDFLRMFNDAVHNECPGVLTIAEESTSWAGVSRPTDQGGLGFDLKWNMGWMHDTLQYIKNDPIYRAYHHGTLTFSLLYAFSEHFLLPLSHDEVVHLKRSMLDKMPGDLWQKFANQRLLYAYQFGHPGKKMNFMGGEFGQWREWNEAMSLDWHLLDQSIYHRQLQNFFRDLSEKYKKHPALYEDDYSWNGFTWLDLHDAQRSILAFARYSNDHQEIIVAAFNFTPIVREDYRLGVPVEGIYEELFNSDAMDYGGSGVVNTEKITSEPVAWHDQGQSVQFRLPPLGAVYLRLSS